MSRYKPLTPEPRNPKPHHYTLKGALKGTLKETMTEAIEESF